MRIDKSEFELILLILIPTVFILSFMDTVNALNGKHFLDIFESNHDRGHSSYMFNVAVLYYIAYFSTMGFFIIQDIGIKKEKIYYFMITKRFDLSLKRLGSYLRGVNFKWRKSDSSK